MSRLTRRQLHGIALRRRSRVLRVKADTLFCFFSSVPCSHGTLFLPGKKSGGQARRFYLMP
jgi:hypothetical protein